MHTGCVWQHPPCFRTHHVVDPGGADQNHSERREAVEEPPVPHELRQQVPLAEGGSMMVKVNPQAYTKNTHAHVHGAALWTMCERTSQRKFDHTCTHKTRARGRHSLFTHMRTCYETHHIQARKHAHTRRHSHSHSLVYLQAENGYAPRTKPRLTHTHEHTRTLKMWPSQMAWYRMSVMRTTQRLKTAPL